MQSRDGRVEMCDCTCVIYVAVEVEACVNHSTQRCTQKREDGQTMEGGKAMCVCVRGAAWTNSIRR
jgi:hypothetical protein